MSIPLYIIRNHIRRPQFLASMRVGEVIGELVAGRGGGGGGRGLAQGAWVGEEGEGEWLMGCFGCSRCFPCVI